MERYVGEKVMGILGEETNYVCTLIILVLWYCGHVVLLAKKQIMLAVDNCPQDQAVRWTESVKY